jgi:hypothetical protein
MASVSSSSSSDKIYLELPRKVIRLYTTILTDGTQEAGTFPPPILPATLPAGTTHPKLYPNDTAVEILSIKRTDNKQPGFSLVKVTEDGVVGYIRTMHLLRTGANMRPFIPSWATPEQRRQIISTFLAPLNPRDLPVFQMKIPQPDDVHEYSPGKYYKMNANGTTSWFVQDPATGNYSLSDTGPQGVSLGGTRRRKCKKGKCKKSRASSRASQQLHRRHSRHSRHSRHHRRR